MTNKRLQVIGFFTLLGLASLAVLMMFRPFFELIALAAILVVLFAPINNRLTAETGSKVFGSLLTLILALFIIFVPVWFMGQVVFNELAHLYASFQSQSGIFNQAGWLSRLPAGLQSLAQNLNTGLGQKLFSLSGDVLQKATGFLLNVPNFLLDCFLLFFTFYYFLYDGDKIKKYAGQVFPLSQKYENIIIEKLEKAVSGVVRGSFLTALVQGAAATGGYLIFGVPQPLLWGVFTVLVSLVPVIGTSLGLIPAVLYLLLTGHTFAGIGLAIWAAVCFAVINNIVSPRLIGNRTNLHPLLVLFSVLGGLRVFGILGFLLGPILTAVFFTLLDIYRTDLAEPPEK